MAKPSQPNTSQQSQSPGPVGYLEIKKSKNLFEQLGRLLNRLSVKFKTHWVQLWIVTFFLWCRFKPPSSSCHSIIIPGLLWAMCWWRGHSLLTKLQLGHCRSRKKERERGRTLCSPKSTVDDYCLCLCELWLWTTSCDRSRLLLSDSADLLVAEIQISKWRNMVIQKKINVYIDK